MMRVCLLDVMQRSERIERGECTGWERCDAVVAERTRLEATW